MNVEDYFIYQVEYHKQDLLKDGNDSVRNFAIEQGLEPTLIYYPVTDAYILKLYNFKTALTENLFITNEYVKYNFLIFDRTTFVPVSIPFDWLLDRADVFTDECPLLRVNNKWTNRFNRLQKKARTLYDTFYKHKTLVPGNFDDFMHWSIYCDFLNEESLFIVENRLRKLMTIHPWAFYILLERRPTDQIIKVIEDQGKRATERGVARYWKKVLAEYPLSIYNRV